MIGDALLEAERAGLILQNIFEEPGAASVASPTAKTASAAAAAGWS